jgi:hypothetical protein
MKDEVPSRLRLSKKKIEDKHVILTFRATPPLERPASSAIEEKVITDEYKRRCNVQHRRNFFGT